MRNQTEGSSLCNCKGLQSQIAAKAHIGGLSVSRLVSN
jgi:hypothetical protein